MLSQNLKKGAPTFFLFEENPYWYSIAAEVLLRGQEKEDQNVVIFGNSMMHPIPRNKTWYISYQNIGELYKTVKNHIRSYTFALFESARPSSRFYKTLMNESKIHIFTIRKTD